MKFLLKEKFWTIRDLHIPNGFKFVGKKVEEDDVEELQLQVMIIKKIKEYIVKDYRDLSPFLRKSKGWCTNQEF